IDLNPFSKGPEKQDIARWHLQIVRDIHISGIWSTSVVRLRNRFWTRGRTCFQGNDCTYDACRYPRSSKSSYQMATLYLPVAAMVIRCWWHIFFIHKLPYISTVFERYALYLFPGSFLFYLK